MWEGRKSRAGVKLTYTDGTPPKKTCDKKQEMSQPLIKNVVPVPLRGFTKGLENVILVLVFVSPQQKYTGYMFGYISFAGMLRLFTCSEILKHLRDTIYNSSIY